MASMIDIAFLRRIIQGAGLAGINYNRAMSIIDRLAGEEKPKPVFTPPKLPPQSHQGGQRAIG